MDVTVLEMVKKYGMMALVLIVMVLVLAVIVIVCIRNAGKLELLSNKLSVMVSIADTTIREEEDYSQKICCIVDGIEIRKEFMQNLAYYKEVPDDILVKKHLEYLKTSAGYSSHDENKMIRRAMMGAAFEKIVRKNTFSPNLCLIHHVISYLYSIGYEDLLVHLVNEVLKYKRSTWCSNVKYVSNIRPGNGVTLTIKYDSRVLSNQCCIKVDMYSEDFLNCNSELELKRTSFSTMKLFISPTLSDDQFLTYRSKKGLTSLVWDFLRRRLGLVSQVRCESIIPEFFVDHVLMRTLNNVCLSDVVKCQDVGIVET
ncbi:hypothetical protein EDL79_01290 [Ehrlichia ruminantium]|uniref:Uncharacterized protein n=1 Tax=Ehrlichia ruminantium TaxID=779 RepID=A0AAE6Q8Q7_EHRRU|nr:hypothetical protein [Ehrlichia ruminantium]QGR02314.1 hypothetical protein EDL81_01290 [Ehrlichia ruminantium]QGR03234.1 hypothetical protein EDL80_01290 [Ehrlichia ruminantium]QGR04159.1 hypothetical protein EDL79_01290 [Ehrlichia ruminantium]